MAFRFTLAAVLKYREALEQFQLTALEKTQREIALVEMKIREAENDLCLLEQHRSQELKRGMPAIHLQEAIEQEHRLTRLKEDLTKQHEQLRVKRAEIFKAYEEAHRNRELLQRLHDRRLEEYTREQAKAEQATLDDLYLARHRQPE